MKQIFFRKGEIVIENVPAPPLKKNRVLVETKFSAISTGTEISSITKSGQSLLKKAQTQPEKVKKALTLISKLGLKNAMTVINNTLSELSPIGYSLSGIVTDLDKENVLNFKVGDRVACAGNQYAYHAEIVSVPKNLTVKIPDEVTLEEASTVAIGSIALQGVRRLNPTLGETIIVIGLGVIGQLTFQILQANGCKVIGVDVEKTKIDIAKMLGLKYAFDSRDEVFDVIMDLTNGYGADGVIITAGSSSNEIISQAFKYCRKKGRVVLVGDVGLNLKREDIYKKELDFLISTSYGPGRYDENYEEKCVDYPIGYVRWTEKRNMEEYLNLIKDKKVNVKDLITKIFNFEDAVSAYKEIKERKDYLFCLFKYKDEIDKSQRLNLNFKCEAVKDKKIKVGIIGLGGFAKGVHLPNLKRLSDLYNIHAVATSDSVNAVNTGKAYNASLITTNYDDIFECEDIDLVFICTRHSNHADLVLKGLSKNKHIFVEKPLATSFDDLKKIEGYYSNINNPKKILMVGFNRRFSPLISKIKEEVGKRVSPLFINYNINAGYVEKDSWMHQDGGRIVGELCHFVDLVLFLTGSSVHKVSYDFCEFKSDSKFYSQDNLSVILKFNDGSVANINYYSLGNKLMPKERLEINFDNKSIVMDDFKEIKSYGIGLNLKSTIANKGHFEELEILYKSLQSGVFPIPLEEMLEVTKITLDIDRGNL